MKYRAVAAILALAFLLLMVSNSHLVPNIWNITEHESNDDTKKSSSIFYGAATTTVYDVPDEPDQPLSPRSLLLWPRPQNCVHRAFVVVVHTRCDAWDRRAEWRRTYARYAEKYNFTIIFTIGRSLEREKGERIREESRLYEDILQGDFVDTYRNITHKQLMHLRYVSSNCSSTPWILKIDDDLPWNIRLIHQFVTAITPTKTAELPYKFDTKYGKKIWCYIWHNSPVQRDKGDKWAVPRSHIPTKYWIDFCSGIGYLMTQPAVKGVLAAAEHAKWLWVDDIFITGYLAKAGGVSLVQASSLFDMDKSRRSLFESQKVIFGLTERETSEQWFWAGNARS